MLAALFASISTYANDSKLEDSNLVVLDQTFESKKVLLAGSTYKVGSERYSYSGTCYDTEYDTYQVCDYSDSGSSSGGSSSHTSGRGTVYRDRRDSRDKSFDKGCTTHTRSYSVPYSCIKWDTRTIAIRDGGESQASLNVVLKNSEILSTPIEFFVSIGDGPTTLGRELLLSAVFDSAYETALTVNKKEISGEQKTDLLYKIEGEVELEAIDVKHAKVATANSLVFDEITKDGITLSLPGIIENTTSLSLELETERNYFILYRKKSLQSFALKDLDMKIEGERTIISIPFKKMEYMKKNKNGLYRFKTKVKYDQKIDYPKMFRKESRESSQKVRINFKKNKITLKE